jgi:hypothetical protein
MIEEIPIEPQNSEDPVEDAAQRRGAVAVGEPVVEAHPPVKRGRGRPKGKAKPKAKPPPRAPTPEPVEPPPPSAKPKAKRAPRVAPRVAPPEYEEEPPPAYDPRQIAAEVLGLLSNRHVDRRDQRRAKYASWFNQYPAY